MGQKFAPSYANIYMSEWEREALAKCTHKPLIYLRFLDDIFGIWNHNINQFGPFIQTLNDHHPTIKVKHSIDRTQINFLDTTVFLQPSTTSHTSLHTKVYFKTTDTHALLHKNSYHPKHTFRGILKSQIIRFHRICSQQSDFNKATSLLFKALRNRGYSKRFLRQTKNSTLASLAPARSNTPSAPAQVSETTPHKELVQGLVPDPNPHPKQGLHPNPAPYPKQGLHPNPDPYPKQGLHPNPDPHPKPNPHPFPDPNRNPHPFPDPNHNPHHLPNPKPNPNTPIPSPNPHPPPLGPDPTKLQGNISTRIIPFISTFSHTITKLHHTIKHNFTHLQTQHPAFHNSKPISAFRRNKNLQDILVHSKYTDHRPQPHIEHSNHYRNRKFITNTYSNTSYPTHGQLSLQTTNTVYIITCTDCHKHYIGETKHSIHTRLKQHIYNISQHKLRTTLVQHFQQHGINKLIISGIEANERWTTGQRKRAEKMWIFKLDTRAPLGLNEKENF